MFDLVRCDFPQLERLRISDTIHLTDLKVTMTLWRLQLEQASSLLQYFAPRDRMASVYGERLVDDPAATLHAANRFLGLGIPAERLDAIAGEHRNDDAKVDGARFSADSRRQAYRKVEDYYGDELDKGLAWMVRNNPGTELIPELPGPLG